MNLKPSFLMPLFCGILLCGSVVALEQSRSIDVYYNNIQVLLNGKALSLRDSQGRGIEPFIYEGTTYLPVRAVGEAVGLDVAWDAKTQSVILNDAQHNNKPNNDSTYITEKTAQAIALQDAGFPASAVANLQTIFDRDDGRAEYDVSWYIEKTKYEYTIDANTGDILEKEESSGTPLAPTPEGNAYIGEQRAKELALIRAGVAHPSSVTNLRVDFDLDDGVAVYEVEWRIGQTEYDCTIEASTGKILEFDVDKD